MRDAMLDAEHAAVPEARVGFLLRWPCGSSRARLSLGGVAHGASDLVPALIDLRRGVGVAGVASALGVVVVVVTPGCRRMARVVVVTHWVMSLAGVVFGFRRPGNLGEVMLMSDAVW